LWIVLTDNRTHDDGCACRSGGCVISDGNGKFHQRIAIFHAKIIRTHFAALFHLFLTIQDQSRFSLLR